MHVFSIDKSNALCIWHISGLVYAMYFIDKHVYYSVQLRTSEELVEPGGT